MSYAAPVVITGPTGWIGTALLAELAAACGPDWAAGVRLFGSSSRPVAAPDGTVLAMRRLQEIGPSDVDGALVVHLAYLTKEKVEQVGSRTFLDTNLAIDEALLAALGGSRPRAVFVASSGAAALAEDGRDRHLYGLAKLMQEDRLLAWGRAAGVPVLAGRIFNIAGPYQNKLASYAIGSFLTQARDTGAIEIAARVPVYRSYLHVGDLCRLALRAEELGEAAAVDLAGAEVLEMADIAVVAAEIAGLPATAIRRGTIDYDRPSRYLGDPTWARTAALRVGYTVRSFRRQVRDSWSFLTT